MEATISRRSFRLKRVRMPKRMWFLADQGGWKMSKLFYEEVAHSITLAEATPTSHADALHAFWAAQNISWKAWRRGKRSSISVTTVERGFVVVSDVATIVRLGYVRKGPVAEAREQWSRLVASARGLWKSVYPG